MWLLSIVGAHVDSSRNKAATDAKARVGNFPFTTIEPNVGVSAFEVRCACAALQLSAQCRPKHGSCVNGVRSVPVKVLDVAGLVPGAHEGLGLGNAFLGDLCGAHVLLHIVDASGTTNEKGEETSGYNPVNDAEWLELEIEQWIHKNLMKHWPAAARRHATKKQSVAKTLQALLGGYGAKTSIVQEVLATEGVQDPCDLTTWDEERVRQFTRDFIAARFRLVLVLNKIDKKDAERWLPKLLAKYTDESRVVLCSAAAETALRGLARKGHIVYDRRTNTLEPGSVEMTDKQRRTFESIRDMIVERFGSTGVQEAINCAVKQAGVVVVYPVRSIHTMMGSEGVLSDAMTVRRGTTFGEVGTMLRWVLGGAAVRSFCSFWLIVAASGHPIAYIECAQTGQRVSEDAVVTDDTNVVRFVWDDPEPERKP